MISEAPDPFKERQIPLSNSTIRVSLNIPAISTINIEKLLSLIENATQVITDEPVKPIVYTGGLGGVGSFNHPKTYKYDMYVPAAHIVVKYTRIGSGPRLLDSIVITPIIDANHDSSRALTVGSSEVAAPQAEKLLAMCETHVVKRVATIARERQEKFDKFIDSLVE